jgi:hypothetical protein
LNDFAMEDPKILGRVLPIAVLVVLCFLAILWALGRF